MWHPRRRLLWPTMPNVNDERMSNETSKSRKLKLSNRVGVSLNVRKKTPREAGEGLLCPWKHGCCLITSFSFLTKMFKLQKNLFAVSFRWLRRYHATTVGTMRISKAAVPAPSHCPHVGCQKEWREIGALMRCKRWIVFLAKTRRMLEESSDFE